MPAPRTVAVIPARHASTRFPGKPLALIAGRPMVEHVWRRCQEARAFDEVWVATDDTRIRDVVEGFGGQAVMTSPACPTGTDRIAEVARARPDVEVWVNVQGDEPLVDPGALKVLADLFQDASVHMGTLVRPLEPEEVDNPNVVKAVLALNGDALYFSRAPVPHAREPGTPVRRHAHLGLYGYRRDTLLQLASFSPTPLEETEKLEQLRALENGLRIRCASVSWRTVAVDVPEDVARVEAVLRERAGVR
ncbi:3-deoxy-manno-octulosonate cytidylyltransferase [Corallococcus interemptor]|uniref:3-deoxy-manno-octulosonate cytidylyltransferase n=1 Tax=Corallococcus TaxID=83461 RepID=UPI001CBF0A4E|nr:MULTISPECIES: 3-deoxy-manno-octulosonate cytidylyltransferase [unclassified Corallococcus]MBZ4332030.1 3-deoxy-manno-octulosonate cytidylyltransferase [Corallococcus sp. AS-1-12]MBZ4373035.1 3-deoxy-manno-octulosonate cytidylyltransferase [Corallococcus sp. AS-1-6]